MNSSIRSRALNRWVPAEHRWLGIDRRTILPAAIVLASAAIMHWGVPWLNEQVSYTEQTVAGNTITLTGDVVFTPPPGWSIESGVVSGDGEPTSQVVLSSGPTTVDLRTAPWSEDLQSLFAQIRASKTVTGQQSGLQFTGSAQPYSTATGERGLFGNFTSTTSTGVIGAVIVGGTGVEVTVVSPTTGNALDGDVGRLVASIASTAATDGAKS